MTVLTGDIVNSPFGGSQIAAISAQLRAYTVDYWNIHKAAIGWLASAPFIQNYPVDANGREVVGHIGNSYLQDFYYRVHVIPASLDLGALLNDQTRTLDVWNAWPDSSQSMTELSLVNYEGITITGDDVYPVNFLPLQQRTWTVNIQTEGPPKINAQATWVFADIPSVTAIIFGTRITLWSISPQWSDNLVETLEWMTDVIPMKSGVEQRRAIRANPRRTWEFSFICQNLDQRVIEATMYQGGSRTWALPVWTDTQRLGTQLNAGAIFIPCTTKDIDFVVGNLIVLLKDSLAYETIEVQSIAENGITLKNPTESTWNAGTKLVPLRSAIFVADPVLNRFSTAAIYGRVQFQSAENESFPALDPATLPQYRGFAVIEDRPEYTEEPKFSYQRNMQRLDYSTGKVTTFDISGKTLRTTTMRWMGDSLAERSRLKNLFYMFRGRLKEAWVPKWSDDLMMVEPVIESSTSMIIESINYSALLKHAVGRQDIRIHLWDGTVLYRRIVEAVSLPNKREALTLDNQYGRAIEVGDVRQITFMVFSRLDGDTVEFQYDTDSSFSLSTTFRGLGNVI